ncbi:MAG: xanthine dehydrogenase family protein molybdopterin-binding subunit, partial [Acidimicrobiia bacterium]|nr:xanthine dehydrogenase family protein molybdopterin-binding subunit [Acidimicrobiia bacterium]
MTAEGDNSKRVLRVEDDGLLDGTRTFIDDLEPRGTLHLAMVRSPVAHARILSVDTADARSMPGIHTVLIGDDIAQHASPTPIGWEHIPGQRRTGSLAMATGKVRYVGHIIAAVIADGRAAAEDAAEAVEIEYDVLPAVMDVAAARRDDAPLLHESWPDNVLAVDQQSSGDGRAALDHASTVVDLELAIGRAFGCPLETRGVIADWGLTGQGNGRRSGSVGRLVVDVNSQSPNRVREVLSQVLGVSVSDVLVRVPAIGGGFGSKANYYGEEIIACIASKVCGRPVKYIEDRYESFVATSHAREAQMSVSIGADSDGTVVAYRNDVVGTLGGEVSSVGMGPVWVSTRAGIGSYQVPNADITTTGVMTNRTPFGSFRGWGSPIANFAIERAIDALADELSVDPVELRLKNMVRADQMPFQNGLGWRLDSGDYPEALRRTRTSVTDAGWFDEVEGARADGRFVGVGFANFVEATGVGNSRKMASLPMDQGGFDEAVVRMDSTGTVQVFTGQTAMGQGIETTLAQVCASELGAAVDDVRVLFGDTDSCPYTGYGTGGCRSAPVAGSSVTLASRKLRTQVLDVASSLLGLPASDLTASESTVSGPSGESVSFADIGMAAYRKLDRLPDHHSPTLHARAVWDPVDRTIGYGSIAVMVEVCAETGIATVLRYHAVDDCGYVVNPAIVDGQVMGAFVQVLGSSLMEELRYDEDGNPVTTTFKDYLVPLAGDVPTMTIEHMETLPPEVPSGSKGVGEAGTIAAMSAIAQAVEHALPGGYGWIRSIPLSPEALL